MVIRACISYSATVDLWKDERLVKRKAEKKEKEKKKKRRREGRVCMCVCVYVPVSPQNGTSANLQHG